MAARRLAYTRREVCLLLGVSERTLIRWHNEGKHLHPIRDHTHPLGRWLYDRDEVDRLARRRRRKPSGHLRIDAGPREIPANAAAAEPTVPGPVAARVYAMLREGRSIDEICEAVVVAPEQVIRLDEMRRQFEAERGRPPRPSQPRLIVDEDDPELSAWGRELDERRTHETDGAASAAHAAGDQPEGAPKSGGAR